MEEGMLLNLKLSKAWTKIIISLLLFDCREVR